MTFPDPAETLYTALNVFLFGETCLQHSQFAYILVLNMSQ